MFGDSEPAPAPVRFGDLEHNTVPPEVAEALLRAYRVRHPREFGELYAELMVGPDAVRKRAQNGASQ